jgi:heterodisulfide reductase subunit A-like polyferredoxin
MFGAPPVFRFSRRPDNFDALVCPMGAIEEGQNGIPLVRRASCVACGWCLKEYAEASASRR